MALADLQGGTIEWVQPGWDRRFDLRSGDHTLGMLAFNTKMGTLASVRIGDGEWTLKRTGFLHPRVTVRAPDGGSDIAVYEPRLRGDGTVRFATGQTFDFRATDFWHRDWAFLDSLGEVVIAFDAGVEESMLRDALKLQLTVRLPNVRVYPNECPVLVALGMYLAVLRQQDSAAT